MRTSLFVLTLLLSFGGVVKADSFDDQPIGIQRSPAHRCYFGRVLGPPKNAEQLAFEERRKPRSLITFVTPYLENGGGSYTPAMLSITVEGEDSQAILELFLKKIMSH